MSCKPRVRIRARVQADAISGLQLRTARAGMRVTLDGLAARSGVNKQIIARFERTGQIAKDHNIEKLRSAMEAAGVIFRCSTSCWVQFGKPLA